MMNFSVYILYSYVLDRFYIGMSKNVDIRLDFHLNPSENRKFTAKANDWNLFLSINELTKNQALKKYKKILEQSPLNKP